MNSDHHTSTWLLESQLEPYVDAFMLHLLDCRYASMKRVFSLAVAVHRAGSLRGTLTATGRLKILLY